MKELLNEVRSYIDDAAAKLDHGEISTLSGLDTKIEELCKQIAALPATEGKLYAEELRKIHNKLDALQQQMVVTQQKIEQELTMLNTRQKAAKAYAKKKGS